MSEILKHVKKENQYYPTPLPLIKKILHDMQYSNNRGIFNELEQLEEINFLEPCAGDGAICREVKSLFNDKEININCIEVDEILRNSLKGQGFNIIGEDFNTFQDIPFYDLIFMNPPFSKGANFLLKAYDLLNANGVLICILNAETINNPCTKERKLLKNLIKRTGEVDFIDECFSESEHKTDVKIAVVQLKKPNYENEFDMFGGIKPEVTTEEEKIREELKDKVEGTDIMPFDKLDHAIGIYRSSVKEIFKGIDAINKIKDTLSLLDNEAKEFNIEPSKFLEIILKKNQEEAKKDTIQVIRKMVWSYILKFCNMDKYLYSRQKNDFYNKLDKGSSTLPFTKSNILQFFNNIFVKRAEYLEKGIIDLFEEITSKHNGNTYHREGWKTNKNWKINKKIIVDWGVKFETWKSDNSGEFKTHYEQEWLNDLDKSVRKIKPLDYECHNIREALETKFHGLGDIGKGQKFSNLCETEYFELKFYKKGTLHITFKDDELLKELNLIGAKLRTDLGYDDFGKK